MLNEQIAALCKKRAQLQTVLFCATVCTDVVLPQVQQAIIQDSMKFLDMTPDKPTKLELLNTLRTQAAGKVCLTSLLLFAS